MFVPQPLSSPVLKNWFTLELDDDKARHLTREQYISARRWLRYARRIMRDNLECVEHTENQKRRRNVKAKKALCAK